MAILPIKVYPDPVLTKIAQNVTEINDDIKQLLDDMVETMYAAPGVGLAAPQVGRSVRIVVFDPKPESEESDLHELINPLIIEKSGKICWEEGCLSVPGIIEDVERAKSVVVQALNRAGEQVTYHFDELPAVIVQHEIDHLEGFIFLDRLSKLKRKMTLRKYKRIHSGDSPPTLETQPVPNVIDK